MAILDVLKAKKHKTSKTIKNHDPGIEVDRI